jgi:hypothetical protein
MGTNGTQRHRRTRAAMSDSGLWPRGLWAVGVQDPPSDTDLRSEDARMPREPVALPGPLSARCLPHSFVLLSPDPAGSPHEEDADYRVVAARRCYCNPASTPAERETPSRAA